MYAYSRLITIDNAKVGEDDAGFAFLYSSTIADLKTAANGGKVQNTDAAGGASGALTVPADLVFSPNLDGSAKYDFEVELYDPTTGQLIAWVQSGVSSAAPTLLYLVYGDSGVTTTQENVTGTWDTDFLAVHHLYDDNGNVDDSTTNSYDGTKKAAGQPAETTGVVGYGQHFDGSDDYISLGTDVCDIGAGDFSVECWLKTTDAVGALVIKGKGADYSWHLNIRAVDTLRMDLTTAAGPEWLLPLQAATPTNDGSWHYVLTTLDQGTPAAYLYVDGPLVNTDNTVNNEPFNQTTLGDCRFGMDDGGAMPYLGDLDEIRISDAVRSLGYSTSVFNTIDDPSSFYGVGGEVRVRPHPPYGYWRRITIDSALVGEDDADFAFLFNSTLADLKTVANGGRVHNTAVGGASGALTVPADLVFAAQTDGTDPYDFEVEYYDATTGELVAWVQSGVSSAADTTLYLVYGDKETASSQENVGGTWEADFLAVWHLGEASGAIYDSTANSHDGTANGDLPTQIGGQIGYAQDLDGAGDYIACGGQTTLQPTTITVEVWVRPETVSGIDTVISKYDGDVNDTHLSYILRLNDGVIEWYVRWAGGGGEYSKAGASTLLANTYWYHLIGTYDGSFIRVYLDGGEDDNTEQAGSIRPSNNVPVWIGYSGYTGNEPWDGPQDEIRISTGARTADYVTTAYNNQDDPSTFYGVTDPDRVRPASAASLPGLIIA